jgi:hypothetical protein
VKIAIGRVTRGVPAALAGPSGPRLLILLAHVLCAAAHAADAAPGQPGVAPVSEEGEARSSAPASPAERDDAHGASEPAAGRARSVLYVPEIVKDQMREEIQQRVMRQAVEERWATPNAIPAWTQRLAFNADVRLRWEMVFFKQGNATSGEFPDFNAINTGAPFDVSSFDIANDRYLNVDQNRRRLRLRARLGIEGDLGQGFSSALRLASGEGSTPVSTNQTLGGSAGNFSKYQLWIDRAALRYEPIRGGPAGLILQGGRFEDPFFRTELTWADDVGFDGFALQGRLPAAKLELFLNAGAFPFFITGLHYPAEQEKKFRSFDKWLLAGQLGVEWSRPEVFSLKLGAAYYYFDHVEGRVSGPCDTTTAKGSCDTDATRPAFAQKGNTYKALRTPDPALSTLSASEYQYFGLASLFREVVLTGRFEVKAAPAWKLAVEAEAVRNLGFSRSRIGDIAVNNRSSCPEPIHCPYAGGNMGYLARIAVGSPTMAKRWSWSASIAYRHVESDAVVDAFTDPDFGLGGTNLKGVTVHGALALAEGVLASVRWMSADAIAAWPYGVDLLQFDVSARY